MKVESTLLLQLPKLITEAIDNFLPVYLQSNEFKALCDKTTLELGCKNVNTKQRFYNMIYIRKQPLTAYIHELVKSVPGVGRPVPVVKDGKEKPVSEAAAPPHVLVVECGHPVPSSPFPETMSQVRSLSHTDIHVLQATYNETFNIAATDSLAERRTKFEHWLMNDG